MNPRAARLSVQRIASEQHGVFHLHQAVAAGMSADAVYRRVQAGEWPKIFGCVFAVGPPTGAWQQRLAALCLWAGAGSAASHRSAGLIWELDGVNGAHVEITYLGRKHPPATGLIIHETTRPFAIQHRTGIPVTSVARTLIDLGSAISKERLEFALEDALRRRLTTIPRLEAALQLEGGKGRRGAKALRSLIDGRGTVTPPTESWLETRLAIVTRKAGLPPLVRQHRVRLTDGRHAFIDFSYPELKVGIEVDGYRWHSGRQAWQADRVRTNELAAIGWRLVRVTKEGLVGDARSLVATLRRLRGEHPLF
jgi:very-short-patch-repair endonuclease